tara:strand:+ start:19621 stop:20349 length:729 start_codon:yes stop_codon:yes gene_type:complete
MKNYKIKPYKSGVFVILMFTTLMFVQCKDDDDNGNVIYQISCDDGIQNGDETGIDCGGTTCQPCIDGGLSFDGNFIQEDIAGRPGVNIIFGITDLSKNNFNNSIVSNRTIFQEDFQEVLENYHDIYAASLDIPIDELNYETNILNWDASTFTTVMSNFDALQVAPNGPTTYYDASNNLVFTGRYLSDDVMDQTLTLMFGGADGTRFDGNNDTPQLTTDAVGPGDRDFSLSFPYLETPLLVED